MVEFNLGSDFDLAAGGRAGRLPVVGPDGAPMTIVPPMPAGAVSLTIRPVFKAGRVDFDRCPICLAAGPDSDEHVGPDALGGKRLTMTCARCNNRLGSILDAPLISWCTETFTRIKVSSEAFRGHRFLRDVDIRTTDRGEIAFVATGRPDGDFLRALELGVPIDVSIRPHNMRLVRLGALKNAYLAACILNDAIPEGDEADAIRDALVSVRDNPASHKTITLADHFEMARSFTAPDQHAVALAAVDAPRIGKATWIAFAGVFTTQWPLSDHPPAVEMPQDAWDELS